MRQPSRLHLALASRQKPKPQPKPETPKKPGVPLPGYDIRKGLDEPTIWQGKKGGKKRLTLSPAGGRLTLALTRRGR